MDQTASDQRGVATASKESRSVGARIRRHPILVAFTAATLIAGTAGGVLWWLNARHFESTDDAFIDTREVPVAAQVSGVITAVSVTDNQLVAAGDPLLRIDPRDYAAALAKAHADVDEAEARIANLKAQRAAQVAAVEQARKQQAEAEAALDFARDEAKRYQALEKRGTGTVQRAQQATSTLGQRRAEVASAAAAVNTAEKKVDVVDAERRSAEAQLERAQASVDQAAADLDRTTPTAPKAGRVSQLSAAKGLFAGKGQSLLVLVPREVWVTANFKETQLTDMRPGQPVTIKVDAYPDREFRGHVDSIQSGSGAAFSLLPPENATGNFVKVVQRVPVKIVFDEQPDVLLGPGMSAVPSVKVR